MNYWEFKNRFAPIVGAAVYRVDRLMEKHGLNDCWVMRVPHEQTSAFNDWVVYGQKHGAIETFGISKTMVMVASDDDATFIRLTFNARLI